MAIKSRVILYVLLGYLIFSVQVQSSGISGPAENQFLASLRQKFDKVSAQQKAQAIAILDTFTTVYNSGLLLQHHKEVIHTTISGFENMRLRPVPDITLYLKGVLSVLRTNYWENNFDNWHQSFSRHLNVRQQRMVLENWQKNLHLFRSNIVYTTPGVQWQLTDPRFTLLYDNNKLKVIFNSGHLICISHGDSIVIHHTRGVVDLIDNILYGQGGKITWERVLLDPAQVYAQLGNYRVDLSAARFEADSVTFFNPDFYPEGVIGRVTDRIQADVRPENAVFPSFESYKIAYEINDIFPGIDYRGGFSMSGQRFLGSGTEEGDASLRFYRNDSLFITIRSQLFSIKDDRIITDNAAIGIYIMGDSIYHPSLRARFLNQTRKLSLQRETTGILSPPFFNSFHQIDMFLESIEWNIDQNKMELKMILGLSQEGTAVFESQDFFCDLLYMRTRALSGLHPLIRLRDFSVRYNSRTFPVLEYARFVSSDIANVRAQITTFAHHGFLTFDKDQQTVTLRDKVFQYVGAHTGNNDFDVLRIESVAPVNAVLNINNFDLHVRGVEKIPLSDARNVVIHPNNNEIILRKNRDIFFNGRIESGLFDFFGKEFYFDYDRFMIKLVNTDSMSFRVRSFEPDTRGQFTEVRVRTVLEGINGELFIDRYNNKSGRFQFPGYPVFNSNNESFVYYDREFVQSGVYRRENFYFRLIPFSIDSLDQATTDNIAFDGVFISTGIFPDFYDYLTVQRDYSLGFNTHTPPEGFPVYSGRALYKGPINLSYEGLRADGQLKFLNADIRFANMMLFPDSARGNVAEIRLSPQDSPFQSPKVMAEGLNMFYNPHKDYMNFSSTAYPMAFYDNMAQMEGSIVLTPQGLSGMGSMEFFAAKLFSDSFNFEMTSFEADNSRLIIPTQGEAAILIEANHYSTKVDFANNMTQMEAISQNTQTIFHHNRFTATGYNIDWDMNSGKLRLENLKHPAISEKATVSPREWILKDFGTNGLLSINPLQESLFFYAGIIDYSLDNKIIHARDVNLIKVADAAIFPFNGEVFVEQQGVFQPIEGATIIADTATMYHQFEAPRVNIASRSRYAASGTYEFADFAGNVQTIYFETINVDRSTKTTVASASIEKDDKFTISPHFRFFGTINLKAGDKNFLYDGATQIIVDCGLSPNWVKFQSRLAADSIFIPISEDLRNEANGRILSSLMLAGDSIHIYPAIFTRQKHHLDLPIVSAKGYLAYNQFSNQFIITSPERHKDSTLAHNIIKIDPLNCKIIGEGEISLTRELGQFGLKTFGSVSHNLYSDSTILNLVMGINFYFAHQPLNLMKRNLVSRQGLDTLRLTSNQLLNFRTNKRASEAYIQLIKDISMGGIMSRVPDELNTTFFLAGLKMKWNQDNTTFHSLQPIGIVNIEDTPVLRYTHGFVEIAKSRGGDIFNMVIIPTGLADEGIGKEWYFFNYANNMLQTISSETGFNDMVRNVNPRRRRMEVDQGQDPFVFVLSSDGRPFDFVRDMRRLLN